MKKITLLLAVIIINIFAHAQDQSVSDMEKKHEVSIIEDTPDQSQTKAFSFSSVLIKTDASKNFTDLYFQDSKEYASKNIFSVYTEKHPKGYFQINAYNNSLPYDAANGFSLGKWNKKGFKMNISLGGKCGL